MKVTDPYFGAVHDVPEEIIQYHDTMLCEGRVCPIHNPTDHHMRDWESVLRLDKHALIERTCPHGIGHPDPDSMDYFKSVDMGHLGVHGCDGCCRPKVKNDN